MEQKNIFFGITIYHGVVLFQPELPLWPSPGWILLDCLGIRSRVVHGKSQSPRVFVSTPVLICTSSTMLGHLYIGWCLHPKVKSIMEWPHRQGGCLACWRLQRCTFDPGCDWAAPIYTMHEALRGYCPCGWGVRPVNWIYRLWRHCP